MYSTSILGSWRSPIDFGGAVARWIPRTSNLSRTWCVAWRWEISRRSRSWTVPGGALGATGWSWLEKDGAHSPGWLHNFLHNTYILTSLHAYIHTYLPTYLRTYIYIYILHIHVYSFIYSFIYLFIYVFIYLYYIYLLYICVCVCRNSVIIEVDIYPLSLRICTSKWFQAGQFPQEASGALLIGEPHPSNCTSAS